MSKLKHAIVGTRIPGVTEDINWQWHASRIAVGYG